MQAAANVASICLCAAILVFGSPSGGTAAEIDCPLPPTPVANAVTRITVDSNRHLAFIYTLRGSKYAVDTSGKLVIWVIGTKATEPEPIVYELGEAKGFAARAALSGSCPGPE
jgi:hypothetical protein